MQVIWNTKDFFKKMGDMESEVTVKAKMAIENVAEDVLAKSQDEVPLDQGDLMRSGHTEHHPDYSLVAYGGMGVDYAVYQHEGMRRDGSHRITRHTYPNRKTKYLEDPIKNNLSRYQEMYGMVLAELII